MSYAQAQTALRNLTIDYYAGNMTYAEYTQRYNATRGAAGF
jgi:hypothetical protein